MNEIMQQVVSAIKFRYGIKTQRQISERLDSVSPSYLSELVNGNLPITKKVIEYFNKEFNINPDYMTTGKGKIWCDKDDIPPSAETLADNSAEKNANAEKFGINQSDSSNKKNQASEAVSLEETLKTLNIALNEIAKQRELIEKLVENVIALSSTASNVEGQGRKN